MRVVRELLELLQVNWQLRKDERRDRARVEQLSGESLVEDVRYLLKAGEVKQPRRAGAQATKPSAPAHHPKGGSRESTTPTRAR